LSASLEWRRVFVHESGHALMAILQGITCYGIFFLKDAKKACTLTPPLPPRSEYSKAHYLFLAAGSAAESIRFGSIDHAASLADRRAFGKPLTTSFERSRDEGALILSGQAERLMRLVLKVTENYEQAHCDTNRLEECEVEIDGVIKKVGVLLSYVQLREAVDA
jgi:hypothetical protein